MKRPTALLLAFAMLCALLFCGCGNGQPETAATPEPEPTPEPTPTIELSFAEAFRDEELPEGVITPEDIAFYYAYENGKGCVDLVRLEEVLEWWSEQETLPRTHIFEQNMPETLQRVLPVLDYAFAHSYGRFCLPSTEFTPTDLAVGRDALLMTYLINNSIVSANPSATYRLDDGSTLRFLDVKFLGMEDRGVMGDYKQAIDTARQIVAGIPEGSGDYDKKMYLYSWLTDNVIYYEGSDDAMDYYKSEWNLLYDAIVKHETVCAGYAEALYVMANLAGVECVPVWGSICSGGMWAGHIWNAAQIDGDFYLFDSTWDAGLPKERYCFFGISEETMQAYYPRLLTGRTKEFCPVCDKELEIPGAVMPPEELKEGEIGEGAYSQPFVDLELSWSDKWTALSHDEISEEFYGLKETHIDKVLRMGSHYLDLVLERDAWRVEVLMELAPVMTSSGLSVEEPADYMDALQLSLPGLLSASGVGGIQAERSETEICGRSYEALTVTGKSNGAGMAQSFFCIRQGNVLVTIVISADSARRCESILQELLAEK